MMETLKKFANMFSLGSRASITVLAALTVLAVATLGVSSYLTVAQVANNEQRLLLMENMNVASFGIYRALGAAVEGEGEAMTAMRAHGNRFDNASSQLRSGQPATGLQPLPERFSEEFTELTTLWREIAGQMNVVLGAADAITVSRDVTQRISNVAPALRDDIETVLNELTDRNASPKFLQLTANQLFLAQRLVSEASKVLFRGHESTADVNKGFENLQRDLTQLTQITRQMLDGDRAVGISAVSSEDLRRILQLTETKATLLRKLLTNHQDDFAKLIEADASSVAAQRNISLWAENMEEFRSKFELESAQSGSYVLETVIGIVAFALIVLLVLSWFAHNRRLLAETDEKRRMQEDQNRRNQDAILNLLDDISGLADGDLSETARVSEDFTGAIADAFNFAIESMRDVVSQINETTDEVIDAANDTQNSALKLAKASRQQTEDINQATSAISEMAEAVASVSGDARDSAVAAQESVGIANKGADAVRRNVRGMDTIREQIQDTSKRIKRLGESSQEIGEIVELIKEIAEQTNLLALNASIQAAMAGESGRGFAVVADEVQRLAERSGNATKQIETLVNTIQVDTNEAIRSMEKSTTEVVAGTRIAQEAGSALEEIEKVSVELSDRIGGIAKASRGQSESATSVNNTMQAIRDITNQTLNGVNQAAVSVGKLAELADTLRDSVSGFKLPK